MNPKFSIIIPVYNVAPYLRECLDSLLAQAFTDWEAICVDDGSTDESGTILDEYAEKNARIRVFHRTNGGVCRARNFALERAAGEWICFLDGDDIVANEWLVAIDAASRETDVDWIQTDYTRWYPWRASELPTIRAFSPMSDVVNFGSSAEVKWCCLAQRTMTWINAYRRSAIGETRFDPAITVCEDTAFEMMMIGRVRRIARVNYRGYYYRMRPESASHRKCPATDALGLLKVLDRAVPLSPSRDVVSSVTKIVNTSFHACFGAGLQGADKKLIRHVKSDVLKLRRVGKVRFSDIPNFKAKATWLLFLLTGDFLALHHFKSKITKCFKR